MLDHAREARSLLEGKTWEDLSNDRTFQLALMHLVEIIGEAASRVTKETRRQSPGIPWPDIIGMRNKIIHGYDVVDLKILWKTAQEDLPILIAELEKILPPDLGLE